MKSDPFYRQFAFQKIVYLLALWAVLFGITIPIIYSLNHIYDAQPALYGYGTFLGDSPKMSMEPNPARANKAKEMALIYNPNDPLTFKCYLERLRDVLIDDYAITRDVKCKREKISSPKEFPSKTRCTVNVTDSDPELGFGSCAIPPIQDGVLINDFGYGNSTPCIMLRLNRLLGFEPQFATALEREHFDVSHHWDRLQHACDNMGKSGHDCCLKKRMQITCDTTNGAVAEIYPKRGIPVCYYPYMFKDKESYEQPFVMLRLSNIKNRTDVQCYVNSEEFANKTEHRIKFTVELKRKRVTAYDKDKDHCIKPFFKLDDKKEKK